MSSTATIPTDYVWEAAKHCFHLCMCDDDLKDSDPEKTEITPDTVLVNDLEFDDVEFLDIVFRLENEFGIVIPRAEVYPAQVLENPAYVQDEKVTSEGLEEISKLCPHMDLTTFRANPIADNFRDHYTVADVYRYLCHKKDEPCQLPLAGT